MSATLSGAPIKFTPIRGPVATTATDAILKVIQPEPQLSRTYYQDGRLLTAEALNRDFAYYDRRLLDIGMALGDGVAQGLAATMPDGVTITVTQGSGIAPSGRIVSYAADNPAATLTANLSDAGLQATLNGSGFQGITDGLYAVVLLHGDVSSGIAEVFPRDLKSRTTTFEMISDTVEIALVGLPQPLPAGTPFQARAQLAKQYATGQAVPSLPEDGVALGVVAMKRGLPVWFDPQLLRHPLRATDDDTAAQDDLTRSYRQIYTDLIASLGTQGITTFRAADVFPTLPPTGLLPSVTVDPTTATQSFFPEQIDVAVVPVRADELDSLLAEAAGEPAIDLTAGTPAQVLVLAPLAPGDYANLAQALLGASTTAVPVAFRPYPSVALPRLDPLVLRLPGRQPTPPSLPDTWKSIWALVPAAIPFMVRPSDGGVSNAAVGMLAAGYSVQAAPPPPTDPRIVTLQQQLADAQAATAAATTQRDQATAQVTDLTAQLATANQQATAATQQSATVQQQVTTANQQLAAATQQASASAQQVTTLTTQLASLNAQVTTLKSDVTRLEAAGGTTTTVAGGTSTVAKEETAATATIDKAAVTATDKTVLDKAPTDTSVIDKTLTEKTTINPTLVTKPE